MIVQIVDARNPLLFRCEDLENYVLEVDANKTNVILINKADYLTENQRLEWLNYFESVNVKVIFWSAKMANDAEKLDNIQAISELSETKLSGVDEGSEDDNDDKHDSRNDDEEKNENTVSEEDESEDQEVSNEEQDSEPKDEENVTSSAATSDIIHESLVNNVQASVESPKLNERCKILSREELIDFLKNIHKNQFKVKQGSTTIGMVGYPNVGKSSTINALLQRKKVAVSETPGKTKHYQVKKKSSFKFPRTRIISFDHFRLSISTRTLYCATVRALCFPRLFRQEAS